MKRIFVDTSAWIAYVKRDDPDHEGVCEAVRRWEGRLLTSNFVFDETVTFLRARMGHAVAQRVGDVMRSMGLVRISGEDEEDAWAWFKQHRDKGYSYTDCTSFALMRRLRVTAALTTDRHFRQSGLQTEP